MSERFDYVKYDEKSVETSTIARKLCEGLEEVIGGLSGAGRAQACALTKLEETYAWIGKAIRDNQRLRAFSPDVAERTTDQ